MKKQHVPIMVLACIALVFLILLLLNANKQTTKMPLTLRVGDQLGFQIDGPGVSFGTAMPGNKVERTIEVTAKEESRVTLDIQGMDFVTASEMSFIVPAGATKKVSLYVDIPPTAEKKTYAGWIELTAKAI
jgi:hypothetical protein